MDSLYFRDFNSTISLTRCCCCELSLRVYLDVTQFGHFSSNLMGLLRAHGQLVSKLLFNAFFVWPHNRGFNGTFREVVRSS